MLSVMVWLQSSLFGASQQPVLSIQSSRTAYLSHGSCQPRPPTPVASVGQASSASAESSPCGAVQFWRLCPSPSQVRHPRSVCHALYLLHHHPGLPHPPNLQNLQDHSDCLRYHSTSPQMLFQALWLSIVPFEHYPYVPALALLLSLRLELAVLPLRSLAPHNPRLISLSLHCLKSAFPVVSRLQASLCAISCAMLPTLRHFLPPSQSCLYSPDDVVVWNALEICHIGPLEVAKGSFSEHWPLYRVLTLLLADMLDVARNGPHWGKLHLLGQRW